MQNKIIFQPNSTSIDDSREGADVETSRLAANQSNSIIKDNASDNEDDHHDGENESPQISQQPAAQILMPSTSGNEQVKEDAVIPIEDSSSFSRRSTATTIQFVIVCAVLLVDSISTTMLFSYVGLLVVHIHPTFTRSTAGYVSGILVGLFQGAQIFTLPFWGGLSDKVGRKPVLMTSLALSAVVALSFGLVSHLWVAFIIRFFHGSIVAGAITVKSYITEITDETNAARAFSMMSLARSFGSFIGPAVGGFLYDPVRNNRYFAYLMGEPLEGPEVPEADRSYFNQLFRDYPALIPGVVLATYAMLVFSLVNCYMVETNPHTVPMHYYLSERCSAMTRGFQVAMHWVRQWFSCCNSSESPSPAVGRRRFRRVAAGEVEADNAEDDIETEGQDLAENVADGSDGKVNDLGGASVEVSATQQSSGVKSTAVGDQKPAYDNNNSSPTDDSTDTPLKVLLAANATLNARPTLGYRDVWTHPVLKYVIPMYMALTSYNIGTVEVIPLFAIAYRKDGGLELTSAQVGGLLMTGAFAAIIANTFFSSVAKRVPLMRLWMCCNLIGAVATFSLATTSVAAGHYVLVFSMVACINLARTTTTTWCFSMYNMFVANVAPKKHLGRVTAMCQATGAMARCFSPMATSAIFAWSISSNDHVFPFNHYFVFCCTAGLAILCMVLSRRIDSDLVTKRHR